MDIYVLVVNHGLDVKQWVLFDHGRSRAMRLCF